MFRWCVGASGCRLLGSSRSSFLAALAVRALFDVPNIAVGVLLVHRLGLHRRRRLGCLCYDFGRLVDRLAGVLLVVSELKFGEHSFDKPRHLGLLDDARVQVVSVFGENVRHNLIDWLLAFKEGKQGDFVDLLDLGLVAKVVLESKLGRVELDAEVDGDNPEGVVVGCHIGDVAGDLLLIQIDYILQIFT